MPRMKDLPSFSPRVCVFILLWIAIFILSDLQFPDQLNQHPQQHSDSGNRHNEYRFDTIADFQSIAFSGMDGRLGISSCLRPTILSNLAVYLNALQKSVRIISLPPPLSADLRSRCNSLGPLKKAIISHPHSIELHFPEILTAMSKHASNQHSYAGVQGVYGEGLGNTVRNDSSNLMNRSLASDTGGFHLDPLWRITDSQSRESADERLGSDPLFFYVAALPYHKIYCTRKKKNQEDWEGRDAYWKSVADYLLADDNQQSFSNKTFTFRNIFMQNVGADFFLPASHPLSGPSRIHPQSLSYLQRATFLKTDFDISGSLMKDIIVPYYTPDTVAVLPADERFGLNARKCRRGSSIVPLTPPKNPSISKRRTLLFFAGSDNPAGGFRSMFLQSLRAVDENIYSNSDSQDHPKNHLSHPEEITKARLSGFKPAVSSKSLSIDNEKMFFSLESSSLPPVHYKEKMLNSTYCLILRGDTTSSKRLFSAIACGCIPVIVSDGIQLPFANIIDYNTFTFTFSESVVNDLGSMFGHLMSVTPDRYSQMRQALADVRPHLLFGYKYALPACDPSPEPNERDLNVYFKSSINPVTLSLLDGLIRREAQCLDASNIGMPATNLCQKLMRRLATAKE